MLLVLLPVAGSEGQQEQTSTTTLLNYLQGRLNPVIRVLRINEASHPTVVRSFHTTQLPAFVLVRQGVELWRQQGVPDGEALVRMLLSKVNQ